MRCIGEVFLLSKKDKVYSRKWQGVHIPQKEKRKKKRNIHLSLDLDLLFVLHVSGFLFNLLSISMITKTLQCYVLHFFVYILGSPDEADDLYEA